MRKCRHKECRAELPPVKASKPIEIAGYCSYDCAAKDGLAKARKTKEREVKDQGKQAKKERLEFYRRQIPWQHEQCKTSFNRMRVQEELMWFSRRGLEPECISCGKIKMDWCCGHFKTVGAQSGIRYDRMNTYLQCNRYCNQALSGNLDGNKNTRGYKRGLAERFGEDDAREIIEHCESKTAPVKWDWQEMEAWRKEWNEQFRELQRQREAA